MNKVKYFSNYIDELEEEIIKERRDFHKYAEYAWTEFRTASKISGYLEYIGLEVKVGEEIFNKEYMFAVPSCNILNMHKKRALQQGAMEKYVDKMNGGCTGVIGILDTKREGPTTAFRFDIDANEGVEDNSLSHRPVKEGFVSVNKGAMHTCGHDGHAAIGLILAKALKSIEENLKGKIIFIFQPAEEGVRGAYSMIKKSVVDEVDYLLCGHIGFKATKLGQIVCGTGGFLPTTKLDVNFEGKSSHAGASPEKGKNALLAAATATLNLHTLCQHGQGVARLNVGTLKAGTGRNLIPDNAEIKLETRGETDDINDYVAKRVKDVIKSAANMYDVGYEIKLAGKAGQGKSDKYLSNIVERQAKLISEVTEIIPYASFTGSEDATYFMNRVQQNKGKATYLMFGTERKADHHNKSFDFDERVLKIAVKIYALTALHINRKDQF